jgi:DNA-binding MarR family transcriptional regulator
MTAYADPEDVARRVADAYPAVYRGARSGVDGEAGITPRMVSALQLLYLEGPLTVGEQADHHGLSRPTMTELVDRLAERHLVDRLPDERDRRRVFVWLTDLGRHHAERSLRVLDPDRLVKAVDRLSATERRHLVLGLEALARALDPDQNHHLEER